MTQVIDPKAQATAYAYDSLSRLERVTQALGLATPGDPNDFSVRYAYDGRGRLAGTVNARGNALDYSYAPWGGLEAILYYPTEADALAQSNLHHTVAYAFDLEGHLTSTSDSDPGLGFSGPLYTADPNTGYDALGRLHQLTVHFPATGAPRTLASRYNRFGEREQLDLAQGSEILSHIWTYDAMGRLDFATLPGSPTPVDFTPFSDDTLARITRPSGATTDYTYFAQGPIESITVKAAGSTQIQRLVYAVDAVQNITSQSEQHATSDPTGAYVYGYDAANRLTSATYPAAYGFTGNQAYVYDPAGNREDPVDASLYAYDANNRLTASPGIPSYTFDDDGNLTARTGETIGYDFTNRLRSFSNSTNAASYAYDPFGRRIRKSVNGVTTWYLWDGDQLLAEYDGSGARKVRYAYAGGFSPAQVAYMNGSAEDVYDVHSDHLDTPRLLTDSSGAVVWREAHEAFDKAYPDENPDGDGTAVKFNLRFPGQYFDAESGLHDNRFRMYDPVTGRYISADPIGQDGGVNVYRYASNNPTRFFDVDGRKLRWTETPSRRDRESLAEGVEYLNDAKASKILADLEREGDTVRIQTIDNGDDRYDFNTKTIYWDPRSGLAIPGSCETRNQSPALGLLHEADHALADLQGRTADQTPDPGDRSENDEERRVINGSERNAAMKLGEPVRSRHGAPGMVPVPVACPSCTE